MQVAQLFELERQAVTQRAFRPQLFDQLFRAVKRSWFVIATLVEYLTPTPRNLLLG